MYIPLPDSFPREIKLRGDLRPGDLGAIIRLHGEVYAQEYGFDHTFEAYVAAGIADFARAGGTPEGRVWVAEKGGSLIGSIAVVRRSEAEAQLRWFLIHPSCRGLGLGRILLREALQFAKEGKYRNIFLWTIQDLTVAAHLYRSSGFKKTGEKTHPLWSKVIHEERYELLLGP